MNKTLECEVCFGKFSSNRKPFIVCEEGHTSCKECVSRVKTCPFCRNNVFENLIINRSLLNTISNINKHVNRLTMIPRDEFNLSGYLIRQESMADIYSAEWNGNPVTIKKLRMNISQKQEQALKEEILTQLKLQHPFILKVYGITQMDGKVAIVMENSDNQSLYYQWRQVDSNQLLEWAIQIGKALTLLEKKGITHGELNPLNISISHSQAKLGEFGISKALSKNQEQTIEFIGMPQYLAPEWSNNSEIKSHLSHKADTFSFAVLLFEMFSGRNAFPHLSGISPALKMAQGVRPELSECTLPSSLKRVSECGWDNDPSERCSVDDILSVLLSIPMEKQEKKLMTNECLICLDDQENYVLKCCGEALCYKCIDGWFEVALKDFSFLPIRCPNCRENGERLSPKAIPYPSKLTDTEIEKIESATIHIEQGDAPCVHSDCQGFIKNPENKTTNRVQCSLCCREMCLNCRVKWSVHNGCSCEEIQENQTDNILSESLKKQLNMVDCPRCGTTAQITPGSRDTVCQNCGTFFCMKCLETFKRSEEHYSSSHPIYDPSDFNEDDFHNKSL
eukprot:gb/GECH01000235.1/.p1 GENE.gb/GECH01000235.1/~~gb/GECH01000235.1/.p1  ORF type:complete len:564 (+),score=72.64 gb/GECH01000235.1/:1-1692(+)